MRWADRFFSRTTPSATPTRRPRLSLVRLEDRAVPDGTATGAPSLKPPDDPTGSDIEVIQEENPTDEATKPVVEIVETAPPTDEATDPGEIKPDPGPEVVDGTDPDWVKRDLEDGTEPPPGDDGTGPVLGLPPGSEVIYYTMAPGTPAHDAPVASLWLGDRVWRDTNGDGHQDAGEPGLGNVAVQLFQGSTLVGSTVTTATGGYLFTPANVHNGTPTNTDDGLHPHTAYQIRIALDQPALAGLRATRTDIGDDIFDSDATTADGAALIPVTTGDAWSVVRYDAGFAPPSAGGGISGKVFRDRNGDGQIDYLNVEERQGLRFVVIRASGPGGTFHAATDATGFYSFANLPAGSYAVTQVKQPTGYASTTPNTVLVPVAGGPVTLNFGEQPRADLWVRQAVSRTYVNVGNEVVVTYRVKNRGAAAAADVKVTTLCGKGLKMLGMVAGGTGAYDAATGVWTVGPLASGAEATCAVRLRVKDQTALGLRAWAGTSTKEDAVGDNQSVVRLKAKATVAAAVKAGFRSLWMTGGWR